MKVTQNPLNNASSIEQSRAADKAAAAKAKGSTVASKNLPNSGSSVEISEGALLMKQASDLAHATPNIRAEKVAALKKSIADGTYKVDAEAVADRLVDDHISSDFGKNSL